MKSKRKEQESILDQYRSQLLGHHRPTLPGVDEAKLCDLNSNSGETELAETKFFDELYEQKSTDDTTVRVLDEFVLCNGSNGQQISLYDIKRLVDDSIDVVAYGSIVENLPQGLNMELYPPSPAPRPVPKLKLKVVKKRGKKIVKPKKGSAKENKRMRQARKQAFERAHAVFNCQQFPFKVGEALEVVTLGRIFEGDDPDHKYHKENCIYPIGYRSFRLYPSVLEPNQKVQYISEILEGEKGPLFRVTHEGGEPVFEGDSSSKVWLQVLQTLNRAREDRGIATKGTAVSGPEMFGFANQKVANLIEGLENVTKCDDYVFRCMRFESAGASDDSDSEEEDTYRRMPLHEMKSAGVQLTKLLLTAKQAIESLASAEENGDAEENGHSKDAPKQLFAIFNKLMEVQVDVDTLVDIGIGKQISHIAKGNSNKKVRKAAKKLKEKWKVKLDSDSQESVDSKSLSILKDCSAQIANLTGDTGKKGGKTKSLVSNLKSIKSKIEYQLENLQGIYVTETTLIETKLGKVVSKISKVPDLDEVAKKAKELKENWQQQLELKLNKKRKLEEEKASSSKRARTEDKSQEEGDDDDDDDEEKHIQSIDELKEIKPLSRKRVKINVIGWDISYARHNTILYLISKEARYCIAGPRVIASPSKRYFEKFVTEWKSFEMCWRSAEIVVSTMSASSRLLTLDQASNGILDGYKKSYIVKLWSEREIVDDAKTKLEMTDDNILTNYDEILSQLTRLTKESGATMNAISYLRSPFGVDLQLNGYRALSKGGRKRARSGKADPNKRRRNNFVGFAAPAPLLVDDLELVRKSEKVNRPSPKYFVFDPAFMDSKDVIYYLQHGTLAYQQDESFDFARKNEFVLPAKFKKVPKEDIIRNGELFSSCLVLWESVKGILSLTGLDPTYYQDFHFFRRMLVVGELDELHAALLRIIAQKPEQSKSKSSSEDSRVRTRRQTQKVAKSNPNAGIQNGDDDTSSFAYDVDDCWPPPHWAVDSTTWPEILRRGLLEEFLNQGERDEALGNLKVLLKELEDTVDQDRLVSLQPDLLASCDEILARLLRHSSATVFSVPVSPDVPGYKDLIKRPMDLGSIRERLHNGHYNPSRKPADVEYSLEIALKEAENVKLADATAKVEDAKSEPVADTKQSPKPSPEVKTVGTVEDVMKTETTKSDTANADAKMEDAKPDTANADVKMEDVKSDTANADAKMEDAKPDTANADVKMEDAKPDTANADVKMEDAKSDTANADVKMEDAKPDTANAVKSENVTKAENEEKNEEEEEDEDDDPDLPLDQLYYKHDCLGGGFEGFAADIRQVWRNCYTFNKGNAKMINQCRQMEDAFVMLYHNVIEDRNPNEPNLESSNRKRFDITKLVDKFTFDNAQKDKSSMDVPLSRKILPTDLELLRKLVEVKDISQLPLEYKIASSFWILDRVLDSPEAHSLIAAKNLRHISVIKAENEAKKQDNKRERQGTRLTEDEYSKMAARLELYERELYQNSIRLKPVGRDRFFNRYWLFDELLDQSGWVLVEHAETGAWGYYDNVDHLRKFVKSLDSRGRREAVLKRRLERRLHGLEEILKHSDHLVQESVKSLIQNMLDSQNKPETSTKVEEDELKQKETEVEEGRSNMKTANEAVNKLEVELEAKKSSSSWEEAKEEASGKVYYYDANRTTQWEKPEVLLQIEALDKELEEKKKELKQAKTVLKNKLREKKELALKVSSSENDGFDDGIVDSDRALVYLMENAKELQSKVPIGKLKSDQKKKYKGKISVIRLNKQFIKEMEHEDWFRRFRQLIAAVMATEHLTTGPSANPSVSITRHEWLTNSNLRVRWRRDLITLGEQVAKESKDKTESLNTLKKLIIELFERFFGEEKDLSNKKAQLVLIRVMQHKWRFKRAVEASDTLSCLGLNVRWLQEMLQIKARSRFNQVHERLFNKFESGFDEDDLSDDESQDVKRNTAALGGLDVSNIIFDSSRTRGNNEVSYKEVEEEEEESSKHNKAEESSAVLSTSSRGRTTRRPVSYYDTKKAPLGEDEEDEGSVQDEGKGNESGSEESNYDEDKGSNSGDSDNSENEETGDDDEGEESETYTRSGRRSRKMGS